LASVIRLAFKLAASTKARIMAASQAQSEVGLKERFYRDFQHAATGNNTQIESLNTASLAGSERNNAIDECLAGIDRLSHEVKDASSYIPAYDQRTYSQVLVTSVSTTISK
jgi:hypothetical protein